MSEELRDAIIADFTNGDVTVNDLWSYVLEEYLEPDGDSPVTEAIILALPHLIRHATKKRDRWTIRELITMSEEVNRV